MNLFSCKVCAEKQARIEDLKSQIKFLQAQVATPQSIDAEVNTMEADAVLSALQHEVVIQEQPVIDPKELDEARRERDRLLSGSY